MSLNQLGKTFRLAFRIELFKDYRTQPISHSKDVLLVGKKMHLAHDKIVTILRLPGFSKWHHVIETGR